ncbi:hypothetical protein ACTM9V_05140 [Oliverpabstia intestinalis]|uniref:hypothetical protein n=1 Tax=Oliverpabstia intestinalis TaxID=2606633 RepID=UPI003F8B2BBA
MLADQQNTCFNTSWPFFLSYNKKEQERRRTHFVLVYPFQFSIPFDIGIIRTDVHQITDVPAALAHGVGLKTFAHLVEQHVKESKTEAGIREVPIAEKIVPFFEY